MLVYISAKFAIALVSEILDRGRAQIAPYGVKRQIWYLQNLVPAKITIFKVDQKYLHEFFKRKILLSL